MSQRYCVCEGLRPIQYGRTFICGACGFGYRPVPSHEERAAYYNSRGESVADHIPRRPRTSNAVRLFFGTLKLVAMLARKVKER